MKHKRNCSICGVEYSYCPDCPTYDDYPRWMFLFHDENCKKIWEVYNDYNTGIKNANQAKYSLQKLDLSKKNHFVPAIKSFLEKICAESTPDRGTDKKNYKKDKE